jgi:uncharacterized protein (DUF1684 family)
MYKSILLRKNSALLPSLLFLALMASSQVVAGSDDAWRQELLNERQQKDVEFKTSVTSPMAGSARLTVTEAEKNFIMIRGGEVSASEQAGAGTVFSLLFRQRSWFWADGTPEVACRLGEHDIAPQKEPLSAGAVFSAGRLSLAAYPGMDLLTLIVFDPQRREILDFKGLLYFLPDARFAVRARLEKFPEKKEVKIPTTRKLEKTFYRYARIHFQLEGRDLALIALKSSLEGPDADYLFIPFKDLTNGKETYEVGRFIDVKEPAQSEFVLDFNRCYNPLCNYSPAYNCPLPPLDNFLDIAVHAGEKAYPH